MQPTIKQDFQLLVCCLMAGHSLALDTLIKHNPKLLVTMEDYLWAKLSLVHSGPQAAPLMGSAGSSFLSGGGGGQAVAGKIYRANTGLLGHSA